MKRTEILFKLAGLLLCLFFLFSATEYKAIEYSFFVTVLIFLGIPHGAIDHLTSEPLINRRGLFIFLALYISLIGLYFITWIYFPIFSLMAFILMSAYHFGQTHFIQRPQKKTGIPLYISRGLFFLFLILGGDFSLTQSILNPIVDITFLQIYLYPILVGSLLLTVSIQLLAKIQITLVDLFELIVLGLILYLSPLMIGFIVYFGFWHALPSMISEYEYLKYYPKYNTVKKFSLQLLPFSIISLLGIGLILFFGIKLLDQNEIILVFFILISLISFPHIFYMDRFWKKIANTDQN